jgi:hypothetical protein
MDRRPCVSVVDQLWTSLAMLGVGVRAFNEKPKQAPRVLYIRDVSRWEYNPPGLGAFPTRRTVSAQLLGSFAGFIQIREQQHRRFCPSICLPQLSPEKDLGTFIVVVGFMPNGVNLELILSPFFCTKNSASSPGRQQLQA